MSKVLVIDTSSKNMYVMVLDGEKTTKKTLVDNQKQHSVLINGVIDEVLQSAKVTLNDIDVFAVGIGVGSFTGIRVGVSVAKGFNLACRKKYIQVNSLQTLAYTKKGLTNCIYDAGKGYYFAVYDGIKEVVDPTLIDDQRAKELSESENAVCFDADADYGEAIEAQVRDKLANGDFSADLVPLYVRRCQAEEELDKCRK